ncbi:MAG: TrkH family potassium uptake protein [Oscillospiraceae bacterium]|nr:TrkH family potassium uptake protein [Oscillospiraceae bacterium]
MNRRFVFSIIARLSLGEGALLLLPAVVALIYGEKQTLAAFLISAVIAAGAGMAVLLLIHPKDSVIYAKEGFVIVALAWIVMSLFGALPFVFSREIPNFVDAFFETVSGFSTTGASILENVEVMSRGCLFWRSFTHWIGGMGVLVFMMAVVNNVTDRSIHIMRAEMPGPQVGKLVPRVKDTAKVLYLIYVALTVIEAVMLIAGGMPVFESIVHAFGTAGTGGFGVRADSIAGYSTYIKIVITVFMLLFGVNFNLYYLLLIRRFRSAVRSTELWCYLAVIVSCTAVIALNVRSLYASFWPALEDASFQVVSIMTTTGYATADFNQWPELSKGILFLLMFVGACAGSTGGGFKLSRVMILFKSIGSELRRMLHPRSVNSVKFEGKPVDKTTLNSVYTYSAVYVLCGAVVFLVLCFEKNFDFEANFTAMVSCLNNIGPGLGAVGPASNYAAYSWVSKLVLSAAMLLGRLEIFPLLIAFSPSTWRRRLK